MGHAANMSLGRKTKVNINFKDSSKMTLNVSAINITFILPLQLWYIQTHYVNEFNVCETKSPSERPRRTNRSGRVKFDGALYWSALRHFIPGFGTSKDLKRTWFQGRTSQLWECWATKYQLFSCVSVMMKEDCQKKSLPTDTTETIGGLPLNGLPLSLSSYQVPSTVSFSRSLTLFSLTALLSFFFSFSTCANANQ